MLYLAGSLQVRRRPHEHRAGVDCYGRTATRLPYHNRCRLFSTSLPPLGQSPRRAGASPPFSLAWQRRVDLRRLVSRSPPLLLLLWLRPKRNRLPYGVAGCTTGSVCPRCPSLRNRVLSLYYTSENSCPMMTMTANN